MSLCILNHGLRRIIYFTLQGEEILSQRSQGSDDDEDEEEQRSLLPQEQSEDEVPAITRIPSGIIFIVIDTGLDIIRENKLV